MSADEDFSAASYYHYTDKAGARAIKEQLYVKPSEGGRDGRGAYVTELRPSAGRDKILHNNYSVRKVRDRSAEKVEYAIRIPKETSPDIVPVKTNTRNIYKSPSGIKLGENPEIIKLPKRK